MKENRETRSRPLEWYKNVNKVTLVGFLGFAGVAAFVAPPLVVPALTLAAIDAGQIVVINRINKKKLRDEQAMSEQVPANAKKEGWFFQKVKEQIFPRSGTIYQKAAA